VRPVWPMHELAGAAGAWFIRTRCDIAQSPIWHLYWMKTKIPVPFFSVRSDTVPWYRYPISNADINPNPTVVFLSEPGLSKTCWDNTPGRWDSTAGHGGCQQYCPGFCSRVLYALHFNTDREVILLAFI